MYTFEKMSLAKIEALELARIYEAGGKIYGYDWLKKRAGRVHGCSDVWTGSMCKCCGKLTHMHVFGCGDKLCPVCVVRKSRATAAQALQVVPLLKGKPILVSLTQSNVWGRLLSDELGSMSKAWQLIQMRRPVKEKLLAWAKTTEITFNPKRQDFHPHIHIIAYIPENETEMLKVSYWQNLWRSVMGLNYNPIVHVTEIYDTKGSVYEVSKYLSKSHSLLTLPNENDKLHSILTIAIATRGRRLRSYGGEWKRVRREMLLKDVENMTDDELTAAGNELDKNICCDREMARVLMHWSDEGYRIVKEGPEVDEKNDWFVSLDGQRQYYIGHERDGGMREMGAVPAHNVPAVETS